MIKNNDVIVFFGDSITQKDKSKVEGAHANDFLGTGYVGLINAHYLINYPEINIRIINQGKNGNTSNDLKQRLKEDCISYNPNYVFIMVGINDIWRKFDTPHIKETVINETEYINNIKYIVSELKNAKATPIIMTPFYLNYDYNNHIRKELNKYNKELLSYCKENNLDIINLDEEFNKLLEKTNKYIFSKDDIHLNLAGHLFIKNKIIKYINSKTKSN